ncbi:MAG: hypothetical protein FJY85_02305 [Deltaproteobacteria bacterium]|nr:hypothetical protein [Deltaproteobacteria bacterium]
MHDFRNRRLYFAYILVAASCVFAFAHKDAFTNAYAISDDVRQQVYWMQGWSDPELYQDALLTR